MSEGSSGLNDPKVILNDKMGHPCSFRTNLVSFRPEDPSDIPNQLLVLDYFAISYGKTALAGR